MELHGEAVEHLDHHTPGPAEEEDTACSLEGVADNPGRAASEDPEADHGHRRWEAHPAAGIAVVLLHLAGPSRRPASVGRPCERAQRLAPARRPE